MKKKLNFYTNTGVGLLFAMVVMVAACTDLDELNTPSNQITADNVDASLLGQAFAQAQFRTMRGQPGGGFQTAQNLFSDLYAQYYATTAENFDSDQYVQVGGWSNGAWNSFYGGPAPQIHFVKTFTAENDMPVLNAVAKVWEVQAYHRMTDYWGPIIYSEFGSGETSVPYDSQEDIYTSFFQVLDEAVANLQSGGSAFAGHDQIFNGDVEQWRIFANSLRLRLAMRISYVNQTLAQSEAEKAVAAGVMTEISHNALVATTDNSRNALETITDWGEFRMSASMESVLQGFDDPRIHEYFDPAVDIGEYRGLRNGLPPQLKGPDKNSGYSDMDIKYLPRAKGGSNPPIDVMRSSEVYFLRAEGALREWDMGGTAQELYEEGIRQSLSDRTDASVGEIDAYISSLNTPAAYENEDFPDWNLSPLSDIPVAWDLMGDMERNLEQIITQKWLALYPDGWEAWAEFRRTGYPKLYPILESQNPSIPEDSGGFHRLIFVTGELSNNAAAVQSAEGLLGGPDANMTKLWWDAKEWR